MDPGLIKTLFVIVAIIASFVWSAYQKRRAEEESSEPLLPPKPKGSGPPSRPGPQRPAQQSRPTEPRSWEEELRRVLQGESPTAPPPVVIVREPAPAPPPLPRARPAPAPRIAEANPMDVGLPVAMPSLTQSAAAHHRATHLDEAVAERMRKVGERLATHKVALGQKTSAVEIRRALALLKDRHSQRAAIIASLILGPPKALEN